MELAGFFLFFGKPFSQLEARKFFVKKSADT